MVLKRIAVVLVAIALVCVAIGAGYLLLSHGSVTVTPPTSAAPKVSSTSPINGAVGAPLNSKVIATFTNAMNPTTLTAATFLVKHGTVTVPGTFTYAGKTITFSPSSTLAVLTAHSVTITTGAKDTAGAALASNFVWSFTTGNTVDNSPPLVTFVSPTPSTSNAPINTKVVANFNKAMDPTTISTSTFTLKQGSSPVTGSVSYSSNAATFIPSANLAAGKSYTATVSTGAKDTVGHPLSGNFAWGFSTGQAADTTPPRVSYTSPSSGATGTAVNAQVLATFSEPMDPDTLTSSSFTLMQGTSPVSGTVSYAGTTATFVPGASLAASTFYTATVTSGARDLAGNAISANFAWGFKTGAGADTTLPRVLSTSPIADATDVPVNRDISAVFSEAMDPATLTVSTFQLMHASNSVQGLVTYAGSTAVFNPAGDLAADTLYTATVTTGARDLAGNAIQANWAWSFRTSTGGTVDTTRPTVNSMDPSAGASGVARATLVAATFSEPMDPSSLTVSSFVLMQGTTSVPGLVSYAGNTATFDPDSDLGSGATFTATITTEARDLAGNTLQSNAVWSFSTGTSACGQSTIALGTASTFAVLAGSTVTSTGGTTVTGDLGASPGTEVTGFPPGTVTGAIHAGDPAAVAGLADITTAYNDGMSRTLCQITVDGNLGGQTLVPGLYWSGSSLEVSSGTLTLDAQGDSNAIFIFKMDSTLTTTEGMQVILAGGALAKNIFWIVGSSATLGTNSVFHGTIIADQSITLTTGASLSGRALARIGAVTLDNNAITVPAA